MALPGVTERDKNGLSWRVNDGLICWERPLRKSDLAALGDTAPTGPILGIRTVDIDAREELIAALPEVFFTIPHFAGYPAVLARLGELPLDVLADLLEQVWRERAPKKLVRARQP
jgi:hypothetical protein